MPPCLHGRNKSSLLLLFAMGAAESSVQRDGTSQEDASVSELSAIQEGGGVLESKVQPHHCPPAFHPAVYALRLWLPTRNPPLDPLLKFGRITLPVRNRSFLLSNGTSCLQPCSSSSSSSGHGSSPCTR